MLLLIVRNIYFILYTLLKVFSLEKIFYSFIIFFILGETAYCDSSHDEENGLETKFFIGCIGIAFLSTLFILFYFSGNSGDSSSRFIIGGEFYRGVTETINIEQPYELITERSAEQDILKVCLLSFRFIFDKSKNFKNMPLEILERMKSYLYNTERVDIAFATLPEAIERQAPVKACIALPTVLKDTQEIFNTQYRGNNIHNVFEKILISQFLNNCHKTAILYSLKDLIEVQFACTEADLNNFEYIAWIFQNIINVNCHEIYSSQGLYWVRITGLVAMKYLIGHKPFLKLLCFKIPKTETVFKNY